MSTPASIREPARDVPVAADCDLVVVGGSCTGVFAAIAAARQGLRVCLVEQLNQFGGTATASMVCVWHALWNTTGTQQIAAGLTQTVIERLRARGAVLENERTCPHWQFCFRPAELACELDELVLQHGIRPFLHARVAAVSGDGRRVDAVIIEDKDGRRAIRCRAVVDASGDADVLRRAG
ncbi:MAG: FAD-dependent oxidoreductase, partial [Planctomycetes bacterium]|nr:FAD-dependent oxidoreductase [Planctomycetota bacterium]